MIFKTTNDSIDKTKQTIALFNKDWNTYKTNWEKGFSQNGIWGGIKSIFQSSNTSSVISKEQIQILRNWNNAVKHGCTQQETFNRIIAGADDNTKMYFAGLNKGKGSIEGLTKANNTSNVSFNASTIAIKAFSIALNMIAFAAIAKGISLIASKMSEMSNATENAIQKGQAFANSLKQEFSNVSENTSTLSELNEEYQRLSKGVDALGRITNLTTEEYDRYKEVISQIHSIMPDLNVYFNEQGEAIGFVGGKLEDVNKEYEKYLKNKADDFFNNGDEEGNTPQSILDEYATTNSKTTGDNWFENMLLSFDNTWKRQKNDIGLYDYTVNDVPTDAVIKQLEEIRNTTKERVADYLKNKKNSDYNFENEDYVASRVIENLLGKTSSEIAKMSDEEFNTVQQAIAQQITNLKSSIENKMSDVRQVLMNELYRNDSYWAIDDSAIRENITTFISSINSDLFDGLEINDMNSLDIFVNDLIGLIKDNPDFSNAWKELFNIDEDIPVNEYIQKVRDYIDVIADALGVDKNNRIQWMISLGFDIEADEASLTGLKEKLSNLNGGAKNQDAAKWVDSLTREELEFAHSDEFINALEEQKKQLGNASLQAYDYENALNKVKSAQSKLGDGSGTTDFTKFLEILGDEAINDYQDKLSSLKSYLDKLKSGDFSSADELSLAKDFKITGDSIEELTEKIQDLMDSEMDSILEQIDNILNTAYRTNNITLLNMISQSDILTKTNFYILNNKLKARKYAILVELNTRLAYYGLMLIAKPV